jgi:rare lipoprotein A
VLNESMQPLSPHYLAALLVALTLAGCASQPPQRAARDISADEIINPDRGTRGNPPVYEVMGQRYYVLDSSSGYRENGMASWYGPDFHGRPTSSGEPYDMHEMTAAHKTLPIPTWVEVTNLRNGRSVIVKVNDRGPFVEGRIIDMSYAAAQSLDMVRAGTAPVEVRALGEPAAAPRIISARVVSEPAPRRFAIISEAAAATPDENDRPMRQVFAQVGAFSDRDNAMRMVNTLEAGGLDSAFVLTETASASVLHRVRIGPLASIDAYDELVELLAALGLTDSRLIVEP